jgi:hypothetical protein
MGLPERNGAKTNLLSTWLFIDLCLPFFLPLPFLPSPAASRLTPTARASTRASLQRRGAGTGSRSASTPSCSCCSSTLSSCCTSELGLHAAAAAARPAGTAHRWQRMKAAVHAAHRVTLPHQPAPRAAPPSCPASAAAAAASANTLPPGPPSRPPSTCCRAVAAASPV